MASDEHLQTTLERLLAGLRGPLETALRASAADAAQEVRQAHEQLAEVRAAAQKQNEELRISAEGQIADLKRMLEDIRETAKQQIDTARLTLETEVAAVRARADTELAEAQRVAQSQVAEVQHIMDERLRAVTRDLDDARQQLEGARKDAETARLAAAPSADSLADDLRSLDEGASLSDVLERLGQAAIHHAQRAALIIVRNERLRAWQLIGFEGRAVDEPLDLGLDQAGIAADALRRGRTVTGTPAPAFAQPGDAGNAAALPVIVGGVVVAILYADAPSGRAGVRWRHENLDVLARYASRVLETVTMQQATGVRPLTSMARQSQSAQARPLAGGSA